MGLEAKRRYPATERAVDNSTFAVPAVTLTFAGTEPSQRTPFLTGVTACNPSPPHLMVRCGDQQVVQTQDGPPSPQEIRCTDD
ncbi:MAG TPA: hypothetical protein VF163_12305 [Micromonosporaceae bacterium]